MPFFEGPEFATSFKHQSSHDNWVLHAQAVEVLGCSPGRYQSAKYAQRNQLWSGAPVRLLQSYSSSSSRRRCPITVEDHIDLQAKISSLFLGITVPCLRGVLMIRDDLEEPECLRRVLEGGYTWHDPINSCSPRDIARGWLSRPGTVDRLLKRIAVHNRDNPQGIPVTR